MYRVQLSIRKNRDPLITSLYLRTVIRCAIKGRPPLTSNLKDAAADDLGLV